VEIGVLGVNMNSKWGAYESVAADFNHDINVQGKVILGSGVVLMDHPLENRTKISSNIFNH
jgi:hypothetical protein